MKKLFNIIKGWFASEIYRSKSANKLSMDRLAKCSDCPFTKKSKILTFINGGAKEIDTLFCLGCGCPVVQKSLVKNEKCPKNRWKK